MKLFVMSDLHVFDSAPNYLQEPSYLKLGSKLASHENPIGALYIWLDKQRHLGNPIACDMLLCPGDLADKALREGLTYGWSAVTSLGTSIGTPIVAATAGNHDVIRNVARLESIELLQSVVPSFPCNDAASGEKYWEQGYCFVRNEQANLLILDSCYHHSSDKEANRGRVDTDTIDKIVADHESLDDGRLNILLCHHHPHPHEGLSLGSEDVMVNGSELLKSLASSKRRWLVIHGHKHHAKLSWASGSNNAPIVFAAGSFSAKVSHPAVNRAGNQFYIIDINPEGSFNIVATYESYSWCQGQGWELSKVGRGLPGRGGFGKRADLESLAKLICQEFSAIPSTSSVKDISTDARYLMPDDLVILRNYLQDLGVKVVSEETGDLYLMR